MKVLLFASNSFLGKAILRYAKTNNIDIECCNSNLEVFNSIKFSKKQFDVLINCAVVTNDSNYNVLIKNQQINLNIIKFWQKFFPNSKLVNFGTSASYQRGFLSSEKDYFISPSNDPYVISKRILLKNLLNINSDFKYFILTSMFGEQYNLQDKHIIPQLISSIYWQRLNRTNDKLKFNIYAKRHFLFVDDVVKFIFNNLDSNEKVMNVVGNVTTIKECYDLICEAFKKNNVVINNNIYNIIEIDSNTTIRFESCANFKYTKLKDSIEKTVKYFLKSIHQNEKS